MLRGPFTGSTKLIAGFWLWRVASLEDVIEWAKRFPNPEGAAAEVELRPVFEAEDFGAAFTPELREQEERQRARSEQLSQRPGS